MARNVEIKARIDNLEQLRLRVETICDAKPETIRQTDYFFAVTRGRLKLRIFGPQRAELIFYRRADEADARLSEYQITPTGFPDQMKELLSCTLGLLGEVHKRRDVYLLGRTRIHLDCVDRLGCFLEIECVLQQHEDPKQGRREVDQLLRKLNIERSQLVPRAYIDLLQDLEQPPHQSSPSR